MLRQHLNQNVLAKIALFVFTLFCLAIPFRELSAQDLILQNLTVTAEETFTTSNSIFAGPNFTVASSGKATFGYGGKVHINGKFVIISGGELQIVSGLLTSVSLPDDKIEVPTEFKVHQNYPNPFNPATTITYELPQTERVEIVVFSIFGQKVKTLVLEEQPSGYHSVVWDGTNSAGVSVSSGVYFYKVTAGSNLMSGKMTLLK